MPSIFVQVVLLLLNIARTSKSSGKFENAQHKKKDMLKYSIFLETEKIPKLSKSNRKQCTNSGVL
jgi:hypothetical protein